MSVTRIFWCGLLACLVLTCAGFWIHDGGAHANPSIYSTANQITHDGLAKTAVLSDGYALYVAELKDGHQVISRIVPGTGEQSTLATPFADVRAMDVSPDHRRLLASPLHAGARSRELWTVPLDRAATTRMGELAADDAAWSPSGEDLVSMKGHEVWITSTQGTNDSEFDLVSATWRRIRRRCGK